MKVLGAIRLKKHFDSYYKNGKTSNTLYIALVNVFRSNDEADTSIRDTIALSSDRKMFTSARYEVFNHL